MKQVSWIFDLIFRNCPTNVDPELCYAICNQMLCWAYPVKAHFRRRRAVTQSFNEKLKLSRRGADFTQEHLDCYWSKPVNQCNKLYENDFDPLNWLGMLNKIANNNKLIFLENYFSLHFMVYGQW